MSRIKVNIDFSELYDELCGSTEEYIKEVIRGDIKQQLKKSPEYKAYIQRATEKAIKGLS